MIERAADQEGQLEALVASTESAVRQAEEGAVSQGEEVRDDQDDARDLLAIVLENAGFSVRTATNGLEALITAHDMRSGVIVMDVSMPVLDGLEATRLIKADNATRHARIIAYTGNPSFEDGSAERLFAAVLTKPATPAAVLATVQHAAAS